MKKPNPNKKQLNNSLNSMPSRDLSSVAIEKELLDELKIILEEDYNVKLSEQAVQRIASFLVNYVIVLRNIDLNYNDD